MKTAKITDANGRLQLYVVDGWITVEMTRAQAEKWNNGDLPDEETVRLRAYTSTSEGPDCTLADLLASEEVSIEDLQNEAIWLGKSAKA